MKRQIIRLTESDLHNMISEAVKVALNELDPRTYASAAIKAINNRDSKGRGTKFYKAAIDSWNNEYGGDYFITDENGVNHEYQGRMAPMEWYSTDFHLGGDDYDYSEKISGGNKLPSHSDGFDALRTAKEKSPHYERYLKGKNVARQMRDSSGQYIKGKGYR